MPSGSVAFTLPRSSRSALGDHFCPCTTSSPSRPRLEATLQTGPRFVAKAQEVALGKDAAGWTRERSRHYPTLGNWRSFPRAPLPGTHRGSTSFCVTSWRSRRDLELSSFPGKGCGAGNWGVGSGGPLGWSPAAPPQRPRRRPRVLAAPNSRCPHRAGTWRGIHRGTL